MEGTQLRWEFEVWVKLADAQLGEELDVSGVQAEEITVSADPENGCATVSGLVTVTQHMAVQAREQLISQLADCDGVLDTEVQWFSKHDLDITQQGVRGRYQAARDAGHGRLRALAATSLDYCPICGGTGAHRGDYCNCAVGDERRRVGPPVEV